MSKVRHVADINDTPVYEENPPNGDDFNSSSSPPCCDHNSASHPSARCVNVTQSPYLHVFFNEHPYMGASITKSSQQALQGHTPLTIVGETHLSLESLSKRRFCQHGREPEVSWVVIDGE